MNVSAYLSLTVLYQKMKSPSMKLIVDTRNGLAGDIMSAGLIGLLADEQKMIDAMTYAGNFLGETKIEWFQEEGAGSLKIDINKQDHLHEGEAKQLLEKILYHCNLAPYYADVSRAALETLCRAEGMVHANHPQLKDHFHGGEVMLHEASDILIDVTGMAMGLALLGVHEVAYVDHVNVGGGTITFSHGTFDVPAPATKHMLEYNKIPWKSNGEMEMTTPTGAALLIGCNAQRMEEAPMPFRAAKAKGTRDLPAVKFYLSIV